MSEIRRVLIDWDYAGRGVWRILSSEELHRETDVDLWPRWEELLTPELLHALADWNVMGEALSREADTVLAKEREFWNDAWNLACRVQGELGESCEVLCHVPGGAWTWVRTPSAWRT